MAQVKDAPTNAEVDAAVERTKDFDGGPQIVKAVYHPEPGVEMLALTLSDGCRLLLPREDLSELKNTTPEQATEVAVIHHGTAVWWPQLDDGIYFPEFLEFRWGNKRLVDRRDGGERYRVEGLE